MIKNIFTTTLVVIVIIMGITFSLLQIYASPDESSYPYNASLIYLATSICLIIWLSRLKKDISIIIKWINIIIVISFASTAVILSLICLYSLPIVGQIDTLASAIFLSSAIMSFSSLFLINRLSV